MLVLARILFVLWNVLITLRKRKEERRKMLRLEDREWNIENRRERSKKQEARFCGI